MRQPNVVLINCDDLGYGDLGCYGSTVHKTPAIDRLAMEGARLSDFYMASPVCSPSRAAMLTGCYPARIGFDGFDGLPVLFPGMPIGLHPSEVTIARMLSDAGYATQMVGKWHCGDQPDFLPTRHGFDHWYGLPYSNDMGIQPPMFSEEDLQKLRDEGVDLPNIGYPPLPLMLDETVLEAQPDQAALTERYLQESIRFMRDNCDDPFFLYFAHMYVHLPLYVQPRFLAESSNSAYGAAVACIDWALDVLMHELESLGLSDDTIVIFTSDNGALCRPGEGSNAPLRSTKGTTWEGGQRVPCIVRWPTEIPAGTEPTEVVTAMDLFPTIAGWCNATAPDDRIIDGRDISDLLSGGSNAASPHEAIFYYSGSNLEAVRAGQWKLHVYKNPLYGGPGVVEELYDLETDIGETNDVATDHPEIVAALRVHIEGARADLGDAVTGVEGTGRRPHGRVDDPQMLTTFDPAHPYYMAEYDLADRG
ncbi:MAG: sulfatase [Acidobacteria bacterium]|nr:sulfatase [Acidobacteriota bacterium]